MKKKKKRMVEIYTANNRWEIVELIRFIRLNIVLLKLADGQIIRRKVNRIRPLIKRVPRKIKECATSEIKKNRKHKNTKSKRGKKKRFPKSAYVIAEYKKDMAKWKKKFYKG